MSTSNLEYHYKVQSFDIRKVYTEFNKPFSNNAFYKNKTGLKENADIVAFSKDNWRCNPLQFCNDHYKQQYLYPIVLACNELGSIYQFTPEEMTSIIAPKFKDILKVLSYGRGDNIGGYEKSLLTPPSTNLARVILGAGGGAGLGNVPQHVHVKADITDLETISYEPVSYGVPKANITGKINSSWISAYTHTQSSLDNIWTIVHDLNKYPVVVLADWDRTIIYAEIQYEDLNTVTVTFSSPATGYAYLT